MLDKQKLGKRVVYLDGKFIPESEAKISLFDAAFVHGDSVQEFTRTFNGKLFKLDEHIERLFRSLQCVRIDPGLNSTKIKEISLEVLRLNRPLLGLNDDGWIIHQISSGILPKWADEISILPKGPTVAVHFKPFHFESYAKYFKTGVHAVNAWTRRISPRGIDPKVKQCSRMDLNLATREVELMDPNAYALLLDQEGNIAEGDGQNFFIVTKGILRTPTLRNVLGGISRETVIELAKEIKIPVKEVDIQPYDVYNADEAFFTATSFCILPVTKFNWTQIDNGKPGPITNRLLKAWSNKVGVDIVEQAISHLEER